MTDSITEPVGNGNNGNRGRHSKLAPNRWWWLVGSIVVVVALQVVWWFWLWYLVDRPTEELGQIGELFGGVSALFSGLAFAGLIYTIVLQQGALEESEKAQAQQATLSAMATLADIYMRQRDIMERGKLRGYLWKAERELADWARKKSAEELSYEKARERGLEGLNQYIKEAPESAVFNNDSKYDPDQFLISFKAWVEARRQSELLLSKLRDDYPSMDRSSLSERAS